MDDNKLFIDLLLGWKKPGIDALISEVNKSVTKRGMPSDSQLFRFRIFVLQNNWQEIIEYLKQREEKAGSEKWRRRLYSGKNLYQLLIKEIIEPVTKLKELNKSSELWGIDFYRFFSYINQERLDVTGYIDSIIRYILVYVIDTLMLRQRDFKIIFKEKNSVMQVEYEGK
jgi:hypothetical protein